MSKKILFCCIAAGLCLLSHAQATSDTTGEFPLIYTFDTRNQEPFELNVPVPDGNYLVTVTVGSRRQAGYTFIKAESRRLYVNDLYTAKGESVTLSFVVNKRDAIIRDSLGTAVGQVKLKSRENGKLNWDDCLNLEILGDAPLVESISIEPAGAVTTIFLCGDSTVVDQDNEPWASWGQMFPWFFDEGIAIANYAESGERADTFIAAGRLEKILSVLQPGDYVFVEFGHNDQKIDSQPGKGAYYYFATQLKTFVDEVRAAGGIPVFVTPTCRRNFDEDGMIVETHLDYPEAMEWVAAREEVPLIDLHRLSAVFFEALGPDDSKAAFVHYPAGSYPGMDKDVADNTHFSPYGAFELAKCVVGSIQIMGLPIAANIINFYGFNPAYPDLPEDYYWVESPYRDLAKQLPEQDDMPTL